MGNFVWMMIVAENKVDRDQNFVTALEVMNKFGYSTSFVFGRRLFEMVSLYTMPPTDQERIVVALQKIDGIRVVFPKEEVVKEALKRE